MKKILAVFVLAATFTALAPRVTHADTPVYNFNCAAYLEQGNGAAGIEAYEACEAQNAANQNNTNPNPAWTDFMNDCMALGYGFEFCATHYLYNSGCDGYSNYGC